MVNGQMVKDVYLFELILFQFCLNVIYVILFMGWMIAQAFDVFAQKWKWNRKIQKLNIS